MSEFEIAFKAKVDRLKENAEIRKEAEIEIAEARCDAYIKAVKEVMDAFSYTRAEVGND